jgi:hypothetical protein
MASAREMSPRPHAARKAFGLFIQEPNQRLIQPLLAAPRLNVVLNQPNRPRSECWGKLARYTPSRSGSQHSARSQWEGYSFLAMAAASTSPAVAVGAPVAKPSLDEVHLRARSLATKTYRPVFWHEDKLYLIDQRGLPTSFELTSCSSVADVAGCIHAMVVRGAPAIGAAGAYGVVIAARGAAASGADVAGVVSACEKARVELDAARPTAVNLMWATERMLMIANAVKAM